VSVQASVVIPAHNEAGVIGRCLRTLLDGAPAGGLEVVVAANGCTDDTAALARAVPGTTVVELAEAGKAGALTAGDAAATAFPRFFLDADLELTYPALVATARALTDRGALAASPRLTIDATGCSRAVRAYYSIWQLMPYGRDSLAGGVYALTAAGRARFGDFPDVIADDLFVRNLFAPAERVRADDATCVVRPPATLRDLVRVQTRARVGNGELREQAPAAPGADKGGLGWIARRLALLARSPRVWPAVPVHAAVYVLVRLRGRRLLREGDRTWSRDESSRVA
jgi:glycosyltransferase involved in cell wall biosynthesis